MTQIYIFPLGFNSLRRGRGGVLPENPGSLRAHPEAASFCPAPPHRECE